MNLFMLLIKIFKLYTKF